MTYIKKELIIFAHIPKTAGTSLRVAVEKVVPDNEILRDYGLASPITSSLIRNTIYQEAGHELAQKADRSRFLFGHFHDSKIGLSGYLKLMPKALLCSFLRDPIKRIVSEYFHFRNHYSYQESFDTFIRQASFINRQSKSIDSIPISAFDFVGITEYFSESLEMFRKISGLRLAENFINRRSEMDSEVSISQAELDYFVHLNIEDIAVYNEAIYRFRCQTDIGQLLPLSSQKRFEGSLAPVDKGMDIVHGWATDYTSYRPVEIEVLCGEHLIYWDTACLFRSDILRAGLHVSGYCGFSIPLKKLLGCCESNSLVVRIRGGSVLGIVPA